MVGLILAQTPSILCFSGCGLHSHGYLLVPNSSSSLSFQHYISTKDTKKSRRKSYFYPLGIFSGSWTCHFHWHSTRLSSLIWLCLATMKTEEVWSWVQTVICPAKNWGFYYNRGRRKPNWKTISPSKDPTRYMLILKGRKNTAQGNWTTR